MVEISIEAPRDPSPTEVRQVAAAVEGFSRRADTQLARMAQASGGDVTRVEGYGNLVQCVAQLQALQASYGSGSLGPALSAPQAALAGLLRHRDAFRAAFAAGPGGGAAVRAIYVGAVMALWAAVSLTVAEAVSFQAVTPGGYLMPRIDEAGAGRAAKSLLVSRLQRFASAAERPDFAPGALAAAARYEEAALAESVWGDLAGVAALAGAAGGLGQGMLGGAAGAAAGGLASRARAAAGGFSAAGAVVGATIGLVLGMLYFARDIAAYVYASRTRAAQWLELQATYLEANSAALEPGRRVPKERQLEYAARLRALADRVRIDAAEADREAAAEARHDDAEQARGGAALRLV